ncbi:hypothetical protein BJX61DRAFT_504191 [Aspergillus egyptiacus]|nr:hypothetical protein BJX61DRAFT_504191 [Aspergillus egyptiacus]
MSYLLLSSDQLDSLAHHYHQSYPPTQESFMYPRAVKPWVATNGLVRGLAVDIDTKRKRFGRFIGLRGCESPVRELSGNEEDRIRDLVEAEWEMAHERAEWEKEQQRREFPT